MEFSRPRRHVRDLRIPQVRLSPAQAVAVGFLALIAVGTVVLSLPVASSSGDGTDLVSSLFTVTSAVTMTGLVVVDTGSHWSGLGQVVILSLIQIGGFGIMSVTSLAGMLLTGRIGLRSRLFTRAENRSLNTGDIGRTVLATLLITVVCEATVTVITAARFASAYGMPLPRACWEGLFHAVSAFNNAGFGLRSDSLVPYVGDAWIILPLAAALMLGGLGFPVIAELWGRLRATVRRTPYRLRRLSVTTRVTVTGTAVLVVAGVGMVAALEWNNTLAGLPTGTRLLAAFFQGVTPRTAGFNSLDYGEFHPVTLMGTDLLMFIGGGSAGTAGGVKITTVAVLVAAIVAEVRGQRVATIGHRSISQPVVRQALTVAAVSVALVVAAVGTVRLLEPQFTGDQVTFEVVSAFATVGLSTGITADLGTASQLVLCALMYLGRIGPVTLVVALAARNSARRFTYPEERPFIG
ncbi:potassium transporter TrkG [Corynebacterium kalidii]|uniref:TrkH family potassium uptake protein n=1 Tax=Corynebacterium kalidii TaxID=2931982 RepID=UPI003F70744D